MAKKDIGFAEVVPNSLIRKVRGIVAPPGRRGTWIRYLNDKQIAEIVVRLQAGIAAHRIAVMAQREWGIKPASQAKSLSRAVRSLRDKIVPDLERLPVRTPDEKKDRELVTDAAKKVQNVINEVAIASWAIKEQVTRVKLWRDKENMAKVPLKGTDTSFMNLMSMLETNIKLKTELGMIDPPTSEHNLDMKHKFDGLVTQVIGEDGKERFLDAIEVMMDKIDDESLMLSQDKEGQYYFEGEAQDGSEKS